MTLGGQKIILCGREADTHESVRKELENAGYIATRCTDAEEAFRVCQQGADLLVLVTPCSDMTHEELLDRLEESGVLIPFLAVVDDNNPDIITSLLKRGAQACLSRTSAKGVVLETAIRSAVSHSTTIRRLRESEQDLTESAHINRILLDALPCEVMMVRSDGIVLACNQAARKNGVTPKKTCYTGRSDNNGRCPFCQCEQAIKSQTSHMHIVTIQGRWFELHWVPIGNETCLHYRFDITERKKTQAEREQVTERYMQIRKMEAIGQLAGGIAQDLGNLLGAIMVYAEKQQNTRSPETDGQEYTDMILSTAERAHALTRELLTFARKREINAEPVDIHKIIKEILHVMRPENERTRIETVTNAEESIVMGDREQLYNAIHNVILNALEAMPEGGTLTFSTSNELGLLSTVSPNNSTAALAPCIRIEICDNGPGMSTDVLGQIFEPFFTTKTPGKGAGLGLSSVYGCIRSHGGTIEAQSQPEKGTTFVIQLPLPAKDEVQHTQKAKEKSDSPEKAPLRVLLVDDNNIVRSVAQRMLEDIGHTVVSFEDGPSALRYFAKHHTEVDLAFLDIMLPGMHGLEIFREMKKQKPDLKAFFITGYAGNVDVNTALQEGLLGVIEKPFSIKDLNTNILRAFADSV